MKYKKGEEVIYKGKDAVITQVNDHAYEYQYQILVNKSALIWAYQFDITEKAEINTPTGKPEHYQKNTIKGLDVIDMIKIFNLNFNEGNILKYLLRKKNQDIQDLTKIINYATRELQHLKELKKDTQNQPNNEITPHGW